MAVKDQFLARGRFSIQSGNQTSFWKDIWLGNQPLYSKYPTLYNIMRNKKATVAQVLQSVPLNISFRRALVGDNLKQWLTLVESLMSISLNEERDVFLWGLTKNKTYTVNSLYNDIMRNEGIKEDCIAWRIKVPLKIKVFFWYLKKGVILTKQNLAKRNWKGSISCCWCSSDENIKHLFFDCHMARRLWNIISFTFGFQPPTDNSDLFGSWLNNFPRKFRSQLLIGAAAVCWAIWLSRNEMVFKRSSSYNSLQVLFRVAYWIRIWSKMSKEEDGEVLRKGCHQLEVTTMEVFYRFGWKSRNRIEL